jgi:penicillin amidase
MLGHRGLYTRLAVVLALAAASGCNGSSGPPDDIGPLGDRLGVDEIIDLQGLEGPVDAVRDVDGRTHIYATSVHDAVLVEGYLVARDRHAQMDLLRRLSSGRIAEAYGELDSSLVETDIAYRHLGLRRVAEVMWNELGEGEVREGMLAFASGVSQLFAELRDGRRPISEDLLGVSPEQFVDWDPVDSLAIGRLQSFLLSYSGDDEIAFQGLFDDLRTTFGADDADPLVALRAGLERDYLRFAPPDPATTIDGLEEIGDGSATRSLSSETPLSRSPEQSPAGAPPRTRAAIAAAAGFLRGLERGRAFFAPSGDFGSNNWAVAPSRSQSGRALLASDPHLSLSSPPVFWPVSLHVDSDSDAFHVGGIAFPGIPGIILGHNANVAWGATVAGYDVTDVYAETLTADGQAVMFQGSEVALETATEEIHVKGGATVVYNVKIVPHHGPIVPTVVDGQVIDPSPDAGALSVRWTGMAPTGDLQAVFGLLRATDVDSARAALAAFGTGAQNWMLADTGGNIGWTSHALVPLREAGALDWDAASYQGLLPCMILPGTGGAEWNGFWADDAVPWRKNPPSGYLATANQDQVGGTLDNDPSNDLQPGGDSGYLGCTFANGFRQGRIRQRIDEQPSGMDLAQMSSIQGDVRSPMGSRMVAPLLLAIDAAQAEVDDPGSYPDLGAIVAESGFDIARVDEAEAMLRQWSNDDFLAASGINPDDGTPLALSELEGRAAQATLLFNAWLVRFLRRVFGDELGRIGRDNGTGQDSTAVLHLLESEPESLATFDAASGDSALWDDIDTAPIESRNERMIRALLDALAWLDDKVGAPDSWRWGAEHTIRFAPDIPLWVNLNVPALGDPTFGDGFPRPGDSFVVDASNFSLSTGLSQGLDFRYRSGPTQRFVVELDPAGPRAQNALPGGASLLPSDGHFADQVDSWRRNETRAVPFLVDDVVAAAESRTVLRAPR